MSCFFPVHRGRGIAAWRLGAPVPSHRRRGRAGAGVGLRHRPGSAGIHVAGGRRTGCTATMANASWCCAPDPFGDESLSHGLVQALARDDDGQLWAGTLRGLDRRRPGSGQFDSLFDGSTADTGPAATIEDLALGADGSLWVATRDAGLFQILDPADLSRFHVFRHDPEDPTSLPGNQLRSVAASAEGVWVGTEDGRVARLTPRRERLRAATRLATSRRHGSGAPRRPVGGALDRSVGWSIPGRAELG